MIYKSPLNYTGGKYKLLPQILQLFPRKIVRFVDLFGGGFNVGNNVKCDNIVYNDICEQLVDLFRNFYKYPVKYIRDKIFSVINEYGLSKSELYGYAYYECDMFSGLSNFNKSGYLNLRDSYNIEPDWIKFFVLIIYSFNNQIRFNSKGCFNASWGKRDFNKSMQKKLDLFLNEMHKKDICFKNVDFRAFSFHNNDFVYCDPPYYGSTVLYGEWSEEDEKDLLRLLDDLNKRGIKFALSNNLKYDNPILKDWIIKYNIHYLSANYSNCNYQKIDKSEDKEVLITNY